MLAVAGQYSQRGLGDPAAEGEEVNEADMAAVRQNVKFQVRRQVVERPKIFDGNDGIIGGGDEGYGSLQACQHGRGDGITGQVVPRTGIRGKWDKSFGHRHAGARGNGVGEIVEVGKERLLLSEGTAPFAAKVNQVKSRGAVQFLRGVVRIERGTDGQGLSQVRERCVAVPPGQPRSKVASQRGTNDVKRRAVFEPGDLLRGGKGFIQQVAAKNAGVERMGIAVVAQVQPENTVAMLVKILADSNVVTRISLAQPAMDQQHNPPGLAAGLGRIKTLQADIARYFQDHRTGGSTHSRRAVAGCTGDYGLKMGIAGQAVRLEVNF